MLQTEMRFDPVKDAGIFSDIEKHIVESFWIYHKRNPVVWQLCQKYAFELKRAGRKKYSVYSIFERIRWHMAVETVGDDFKLNNNYRPCYARLLILTYPEFTGFFETRSSIKH